jgi:Domain of unknown function (DUF4328)
MQRPIRADRGAMAVSAPPFAQYGSHRIADPGDPPRQMLGLAWGVVVCLGIVGLLYVGTIIAALSLHAAAGGEGNIADDYHTYSAWIGFSGLAFLVSAVVFIAWFNRAYKNLRRLGVQNMRYGPGWAIGAWFVPILSLFRPKQIANDIWRGSERGVEVSTQWHEVWVPSLLHWWWGLFLAQGTLTWIGERLTAAGYGKLTTFEGSLGSGFSQIKSGTIVDVLGSLTGIAAAIVAIMIVSQLTTRLDEAREDALTAKPVAPPPPGMAPPVTTVPPPPSFPPPPTAAMTSMPPPSALGSVPPPATSEQRIRCPQCAEWILPQAKVCRFCGHHLEWS